MSDINTAAVDGLKALDLDRPIREADMSASGLLPCKLAAEPHFTIANPCCNCTVSRRDPEPWTDNATTRFHQSAGEVNNVLPSQPCAQHAIPGTTRAYVMNGLFVGTGLATIAARTSPARLHRRLRRLLASQLCGRCRAHPADRIVVIGHSFGAEAAARCRPRRRPVARDLIMIHIDAEAPSEVGRCRTR